MNGILHKHRLEKNSKMQNKKIRSLAIITIILLLISILLALSMLITNNENEAIKNTEEIKGIVTNVWIPQANLENLKENKITHLFVDIGNIDTTGIIQTPKEEIINFINGLKSFESSNNYNFIILPYTEIILDEYSLTEEFQNNLINEHKSLMALGFNGVFIDIEKIPLSQRQNYISFINKLIQNIQKDSPSATLAIYAAHLAQNPSEWEWDLALYKAISEKADLIIIPAYDTNAQNIISYNYQLSNQIEQLNNINSKAKFILGIPTHKQAPETIENALKLYQRSRNQEKSNFIGISFFAEWTMDENEWETYKIFINSSEQ